MTDQSPCSNDGGASTHRRVVPSHPLEAHARDLRVSRWYRLLYLAGVIWMIWFALHFLLPSAKVTFGWAGGVLIGAPFASAYWWEGIALAAFASLNVLLPLGVIVRNRVRAGKAAA